MIRVLGVFVMKSGYDVTYLSYVCRVTSHTNFQRGMKILTGFISEQVGNIQANVQVSVRRPHELFTDQCRV